MSSSHSRLDPTRLEARTRAIGRELFHDLRSGSAPWNRSWWDDRMMALSMGDPATKVQLFRFIDALPTLRTDAEVRRHLEEYLDEAGANVPTLVRLPLHLAPRGPMGDRLIARLARSGAMTMARRFIAGSTPREAARTVLRLREDRVAFTADLLGEAVITEPEAVSYQQTCLELLSGLAAPLNSAEEVPQIDRDADGPIPRVNLSLKLTSLVPLFDPIGEESTTQAVLERLRPILREARRIGAFVNVDMEQYAFKDLTYAIFRRVLEEPEFRDWEHAGVVCQAYQPEALRDLEALDVWVAGRGTPITVRLVKGAYWDYETLHARQLGWPVPVYERKTATDANYERCAEFLIARRDRLRPAFGSHNVRSLAHAIACAELSGLPEDAYEVQMLYGMGDTIQHAIVRRGLRLRLYTPYGAMLPGMAYLVRRLLENTSNESFLKASLVERVSADELLANPAEMDAMWARRRSTTGSYGSAPGREPLPPFRNEPPTDFTRDESRDAMQSALARVRAELSVGPVRLDPIIGGRTLLCVDRLETRDPSHLERLVSDVGQAGAEEAVKAVEAARDAAAGWAARTPQERAEVLLRTAAILREERFLLAAWEVYECGKPWREADADVAEAIDFCEFYAREAIRLAAGERRDVPGETNRAEQIPRGVAVVIPPWNFPLAIPCGMTTAALVAGNTVVLKPAEQSQVMAWRLHHALERAGLPPGVLNFLPGPGETAGAALVVDTRVHLIAFTGSRPVGLEINRRASETPNGQDHVKRVIAEMGGKNAIIVDDDADLDEAVVGILTSAFGYAGQKCSACSRVVALDGVYDALTARLADGVRTLPVGPADEPETIVGPVISAEARDRIVEYRRVAVSEGRVVADIPVGELAERGHFVGPLIVADVNPEARTAQEEIFGPVLVMIRARDLGDALRIANGTDYALTGGLYSRSPADIERVKREFLVGNLYINRSITGALVDRQPFGGFKLSGIGTKAGGSDYLREFLLTRVVTENTMRRGFAPEDMSAVGAVATTAAHGI